MREFDYLRPSSLVEACQFLRDSDGQRKALAGGTDLLVQVKQERLRLQAVVSLRDLPELAFIRHKPGHGLILGAMTRLREIETSRDVLVQYPAVAEAASWIGSVQVRTRATLGGNLCNAAPSADMAPSLIAYGASAILTNGQKDWEVPLEGFFTGPGQIVLKQGELLKGISLPPAPKRSFGTYLKAYRSRMDIAVVGVGILAILEENKEICREVRLVLGAVAPTPIRAVESERMVAGKKLDDELIEAVSQKASREARPISDVRSSAEYRKTLVRILTRRALRAARSWAEKGVSQ
jgi:carbon-monoxide dehydrogenase medium subunit